MIPIAAESIIYIYIVSWFIGLTKFPQLGACVIIYYNCTY